MLSSLLKVRNVHAIQAQHRKERIVQNGPDTKVSFARCPLLKPPQKLAVVLHQVGRV